MAKSKRASNENMFSKALKTATATAAKKTEEKMELNEVNLEEEKGVVVETKEDTNKENVEDEVEIPAPEVKQEIVLEGKVERSKEEEKFYVKQREIFQEMVTAYLLGQVQDIMNGIPKERGISKCIYLDGEIDKYIMEKSRQTGVKPSKLANMMLQYVKNLLDPEE